MQSSIVILLVIRTSNQKEIRSKIIRVYGFSILIGNMEENLISLFVFKCFFQIFLDLS